MKKLIYKIALLILLPNLIYAQVELDYDDDINPYFIGDSSELVFPLLFDFFKSNNEHPASNIQLAIIFEARYKNAHPISDYESAIANAEKAKLLFGRARDLIDDREVRRNAWHYPNFTNEFKRNGKPVVEFETIKLVFQKGLEEADSFLTYLPPIHENFMSMVEKYDLASKNFVRINGDYNSLKDIYLLYDDELEKRFDLVSNNYDSTLYYFKKYREAANSYPPFALKQQLTFSDIKTYRLDGLVIQTDFLVENINLWDYTSWIKQVKKVIETEISQLRNDIEKIERELENSMERMNKWSLSDSINVDPIERKSIYKIRKYDLNSPVANLFQYKDDKLDLLKEQKSLSVYDTAENVSFQVKLFTINRVFQKTITLENNLKTYSSDLMRSNLNKNESFYKKYYNGIEEFKSYFKEEEKELLKIRGLTADRLKTQIIDQYENPFTQDNTTFKRVKFAWQNPANEYDSLLKDLAYINYSATNVNDLEYIGGYYLNSDSVPQAFYGAKKGEEVKWYKRTPSNYEADKAWQKLTSINVVGGGDLSLLLFESHVDSLDFVNHILISDENGQIKNDIVLDIQDKPVLLSSIRNSSVQMAFYQGDGLGDAVWPSFLKVVKFHPDSAEYISKEIDINGKFEGLFQTDAGMILVSSSEDGKTFYASLFDIDFKLLKTEAFIFNQPVDIKYSYQISENSLHLLSGRGERGHLVLTDELELRYADIELTEDGL